jgi:uroporphyrinogen decarboxylase
MNAKENALAIIRFNHPERIVSGVPGYGLCYHGCNHEGYEGGGHDCPVGSRWTDIWGTTWHKEHADVMGFPRGNPLAEPENLRTYRWPDPDDERIVAAIYKGHAAFMAAGTGGEQFLCGSHRDTLWEKSYMLAGMENMMVNFRLEPNFVREVLHRIMDFQMGIARHYLKLGIEMANLGDDLGTQCGPLLGGEIVNEFLVPEYRRLFGLYRSRGVLIGFHSCGRVHEMLPIFMDLGVNVLNPVQATANDLDFVRRQTAGRMALQGGVSTHTIMAGPVEAIVAETRQRMWQLGADGGYFCSPDQGMPFPPAHIAAVNETVERFGRYPITKPT